MKRILLLASLSCSIWCNAHNQQPMRLWYDRPAHYFEESLPIGNGRLGALVYGGKDTCTIHLNDITFWTGKPVDREQDSEAHQWLPKIREALFREDYHAADSLQRFVQGPYSQYYQPLGTLQLVDLNEGRTSGYRRALSLDSAIVSDQYVRNGITMRREYFASAPDSLIAIRLTGDVNVKLLLTAKVPHKVKAWGNQLTQTGHAVGDAQETIHFCTIVQATVDSGSVEANDSSLTIRGAKEAIIYLVNRTSFNGFNRHPVREGAAYIEKATDDIWHTKNLTYQQMRQRHVSDYLQYYDRVKLQLGEASQNNEALDITTERLLKNKRHHVPHKL